MSISSSLESKRILVTGGAGFIGSHLVERLLDLNCHVVVLDNLSSGKLQNIPCDSRRLSFVEGDIRDFAMVKRVTKKADTVFHLAEFIPNTKQSGPGHVIKFSMEKPLVDLDICVKGTLNVLEAAKQAHTKVVFTSTAAVYGKTPARRFKETSPANPISPYGVSKLSAEMYCKMFNETHELPVLVVRLFNVFGPRQRKYIMYDILLKLEKNPYALEMLGSGNQERDFVYVSDVVDGLIFLSAREEAYGETFNLGTGVPTSIKEVVTLITNFLGPKPKVSYTGDSWKGDIKTLVADITKLRKIGFIPKCSLVQGIEKFVSWYQHFE